MSSADRNGRDAPGASTPRLDRPGNLNPDGRPYFAGFDPALVPSPSFVVDRAAVEFNLRILRDVADASGARILLALKAFALPGLMDLIDRYLDGACASGVYEARLAREMMTGEVHSFAPAYSDRDLHDLISLSDHLSFNSLAHWVYHRDRAASPVRSVLGRATISGATVTGDSSAGDGRPADVGPAFGLRVNPEFSTGSVGIYDPCAPYSRLGITRSQFDLEAAELSGPLVGLSGIHMHTLCESSAQALADTVAALEERFGLLLERPEITWLNLGGGHHITRPDYDRDLLVTIVRRLRERYGVRVILEPGEAVVIHSGILVSTVLDLPRNGMNLAILDTSATAHMPDTLEMPYRPDVWGAGAPSATANSYRLGGQTCLAGDVIGDYSFSRPLHVGDRLVFDDMSHYTMVKTTTFNGIPLPGICLFDSSTGKLEQLRRSDYSDFRTRLGGVRGALALEAQVDPSQTSDGSTSTPGSLRSGQTGGEQQ